MTEDQFEENTKNSVPNGEGEIWHVLPVIEFSVFTFLKSRFKKMFGKLNIDEALQKSDSILKSILEKENQIVFCVEP